MTDDVILDAENFQGGGFGKDKITFPVIVLFQVQKCGSLGSGDHHHGGYWSHVEKIIAGGITSTDLYTYNESKGRAFEASVLTLYDLLSGQSKRDILDEAFGLYEKEVAALIAAHNAEVKTKEDEKKVGEQWFMKQNTILCANRAKASRGLFRACLTWLKKNSYLSGESIYEGEDVEL